MVAKKEKNEKLEQKVDVKDVPAKWYVFRVQSGREDSLIQSLKNSFPSMKRDGLNGEDYFLDFSAPKRTIIKYNDGKKTEKEITVYPGYIFLKIKMTDEITLYLRNFFRQNGFGAMLPKTITDAEYEKMMAGVNGLSEKAKDFVFAVGQKVKINAGSFASMEGNIDTINDAEKKLVVSVMIFGCETKIDVDFDQVSIIQDAKE